MIQTRNFWMYVLLSIVTCGIYSIIFWYQFAEDMNIVCNSDGSQTNNYVIVFLLGLVTCGIYPIVWFYGIGNRLAENAPRYGMNFTENGTTILMWYLFGILLCGIGPYIAWYILIRNMNEIAERYNEGIPQA